MLPRAATTVVLVMLLIAHVAVKAQVPRPYQLVMGPDIPWEREQQAAMCRQVLKNLNDTNHEPPMTCQRSFDPTYAFSTIPEWKALNDEEAFEAALGWGGNMAKRGPPSEVESRFAKHLLLIQRIAKTGELKAWQATLELVKNGEQVRVVLFSYGRYKFRGQCFDDTKLGVFLPDRFQIDDRYANLSIGNADEVILHEGIAYIAQWDAYPSATPSNRAGPEKKHRAYLLIQQVYWLKEGYGGPLGGIAGRGHIVCQIGYQRLVPQRKPQTK